MELLYMLCSMKFPKREHKKQDTAIPSNILPELVHL